jgi:hypothetical protein
MLPFGNMLLPFRNTANGCVDHQLRAPTAVAKKRPQGSFLFRGAEN